MTSQSGLAPMCGGSRREWSGRLLGPGLVRRRGQLGVRPRHEAVVGEFGAEVGGVLVGDDLTVVAGLRERGRDELVHSQPLGTADLLRGVQGFAARYPRDGRTDVAGCDRLV